MAIDNWRRVTSSDETILKFIKKIKYEICRALIVDGDHRSASRYLMGLSPFYPGHENRSISPFLTRTPLYVFDIWCSYRIQYSINKKKFRSNLKTTPCISEFDFIFIQMILLLNYLVQIVSNEHFSDTKWIILNLLSYN